MKRLLILLAFLSFCTSEVRALTSDPSVPITTLKQLYCNKEHGIIICTTHKFKPYTGIIKEEYSNGHLKMMAYFKNGKANGLRKEYYDNGQLKEESFYKNGKLDGLVISYYKNGLLEEEAYYKDGKIDGRWKLYDKNGGIQNEKFFSDGNETVAVSYGYQQQQAQ